MNHKNGASIVISINELKSIFEPIEKKLFLTSNDNIYQRLLKNWPVIQTYLANFCSPDVCKFRDALRKKHCNGEIKLIEWSYLPRVASNHSLDLCVEQDIKKNIKEYIYIYQQKNKLKCIKNH